MGLRLALIFWAWLGRHSQRYISALAEGSWQQQNLMLRQLATYLKPLVDTGSLLPLVFIHHVRYDETPMRLMDYAKLDGGGEIAVKKFEQTLSKIYVVEHGWSAVCQFRPTSLRDPNFCKDAVVIRGEMSPCIRSSARGTGENIHAVLESAWNIPDQLCSPFTKEWRLVERDENGANARAELLRSKKAPHEWKLSTLCLATRLTR